MRRPWFVLTVLGTLLAACGDTAQVPEVASVAIVPDSATLVVGDSLTFTAVASDASGNPVTGQTILWSINDQTIATIGPTGATDATKPGFALVRATAGGVVGIAKLLVIPGAPASVRIQPDSAVLDVGTSRTFEALVKDATGTTLNGLNLIWSSTVPATGVISAPGVLSGSAAGTTFVVATVEGVADTARALVADLAFRRIAAGGSHSCASSVGLSTYCWGNAANGVLGNAATAGTASTPTRARTGVDLIAVSAGPTHSCALERAGSVYCWGRNTRGQLGDGTTTTRSEPAFVLTDVGFTAIAVGSEHTCAIAQAGNAYCWGRNDVSQIGQDKDPEPSFGQPAPVHPLPLPVQLSPTFVSITAGLAHSCGLTASGTAYCWGDGRNGAVGDGQRNVVGAPALVAGGLAFAALSAGRDYTCGVTTGGAAYCWGRGLVGQLGTGDTLHLTPTAVTGGLSFTTVAAGNTHTCALTAAGAGYCWGSGTFGQLGQGVNASSAEPVAVTGGLAFIQIVVSAGTAGGHTCVTTADAIGYCWGRNDISQLGDGGTADQAAPTRVSGQ